jgi:hypothetical protein
MIRAYHGNAKHMKQKGSQQIVQTAHMTANEMFDRAVKCTDRKFSSRASILEIYTNVVQVHKTRASSQYARPGTVFLMAIFYRTQEDSFQAQIAAVKTFNEDI